MSKRLTAALLASLTFAAVLAVVSQPVAAHTQTVKRCAFDPFAGQQCWRETVAHTHPPPTVNQQIVPQGPNTEIEPGPDPDDAAKKKAAEEAAKKKAAEETAKRKADEEARRQRRAAEEEAKRRAEQEAKRKAAEEAERKRKEAEEAERKRKQAAEDAKKCPPRQTSTPPNCRTDLRLCGTPQSSAHARECEAERKRQKAEKDAAKKKAQQEARKPVPCGGSGGQGSTPHHKHHGPCHPDTPGHTHASSPKCPTHYDWNGVTNKCEMPDTLRIVSKAAGIALEVEGAIICFFAADRVAAKVVNTILKGVSEAAKAVAKFSFEQQVQAPCDLAWTKLTTWTKNYLNSPIGKPDTTTPKDGGTSQPEPKNKVTVEDVTEANEAAREDPWNEQKRKHADEVWRRYRCQNGYSNTDCDGTE